MKEAASTANHLRRSERAMGRLLTACTALALLAVHCCHAARTHDHFNHAVDYSTVQYEPCSLGWHCAGENELVAERWGWLQLALFQCINHMKTITHSNNQLGYLQ